MARAPRKTKINVADLGAPEWFQPVADTLNPFLQDVSDAFQGGISSENIREQFEQIEITTLGNPDDTFTNFRVQLKNKLGISPGSVILTAVSARFETPVTTGLLKKHTVGGTDEPSFEGTWATGSPAPKFWLDPWGYTHFEGLVTAGVLGTSAFTLPSQYRPEVTLRFPTDSNGAYGAVVINTTGTVVPTVGSTTNVNLSPVVFRASGDYGMAVGQPIWQYHNNGLIEITYIPGLRPNTVYTLGFLIR